MSEKPKVPPSTEHVVGGLNIRVVDSFPPNANPFNHDGYHMGRTLPNLTGVGPWAVMYDHKGEYLILIHLPTGRRVVITPEEAGNAVTPKEDEKKTEVTEEDPEHRAERLNEQSTQDYMEGYGRA